MAEPNATVNETGRILAIEGYTLLLLEICIIFLNVSAVMVIIRFKRKHNPDILILTLAIADLAKACIPLNMTLVAYLGGLHMKTGSLSCAIFGWTAFTLNSGIMLVMTFMAMDRYVAICWPFKYKAFLSRKRLIYTIVAIFVFSGLHSMLPLVGVGWMKSFNHGTFCHFDFDSTVGASVGYKIFVLVLGISMLIVVIFCYSRAMFSIRALIRRQTRRMSTSSREIRTSEQKQQAMNHMFARLMLVMMVVFCISWLLFLVVVLQHTSGWFNIPTEAHFWSMRLAVANSIFNPLIGAIMCKPYRSGYLFFLCKLLHCFGLCSSYQAQDPWAPSRKLSNSSRKSLSFEPPGTTAKEKEGGYAGTSINCNFDSGIVSDSPGAFPQSGVTNPSFEMNMEEMDGNIDKAVESKTSRRPGLGRKRISFKDEHEAIRMEALSAVEEIVTKPDNIGKQLQNVENESLPQWSDEQLTESTRLKTARIEFPKDDSLVERAQENSSLMFAQYAEITKKCSFGRRQRKYGFQGIHPENTASGRNPVGESEGNPTSIENEGSLLHEGSVNLPRPSSYHAQPTRGKLDNETEGLPDERKGHESRENSTARQALETGDCPHDGELHHNQLPRPLVQITDFPVDSKNKTIIAAKKTATDSVINQAPMSLTREKDSAILSCENKARSLETSSCRTLGSEPRTLEEDFAYQQSNGGIPMDVSARKQDSPVRKYSDHPTTPKRAHGSGPLFNKQTFEPNESLLLEPLLVSTDYSKPYRRYDMPPFRRQSFSFGTDSVHGLSRWRLSEPDLTRVLPDATAPSQDSTTGFTRARVRRNTASEAPRAPREGNENGVFSRPVCTSGQQRKSSRIYRALSERSQAELEREVFC